jgi:Tfp pilus assembly protein PilV
VKTPKRLQRGISLLENLLAMGILLTGAAGVVAIQRQATFYLGDARRITRAAAFAGDLVTQIKLWDFDDPRLANSNTGNDDDVGDSASLFETQASPPADHGEADLTLGGRVWTGLPQELLVQNGMERYWNVSLTNAAGALLDDENGNGVPDAMRIAVIVRWQAAGGWRRIVVPVVKVNPAERM